jgi:hypothetical protein
MFDELEELIDDDDLTYTSLYPNLGDDLDEDKLFTEIPY